MTWDANGGTNEAAWSQTKCRQPTWKRLSKEEDISDKCRDEQRLGAGGETQGDKR